MAFVQEQHDGAIAMVRVGGRFKERRENGCRVADAAPGVKTDCSATETMLASQQRRGQDYFFFPRLFCFARLLFFNTTIPSTVTMAPTPTNSKLNTSPERVGSMPRTSINPPQNTATIAIKLPGDNTVYRKACQKYLSLFSGCPRRLPSWFPASS